MSVPRLAVVLPCWNAAPYLDRALASLAAQTFTDFDVIAVDDGSTDETPRLLEAWARQDARLRWLRRAHEGLVAALNAGLEQIRAPLVARMDGDDMAHPRRFAWQVALLDSRPDVTVAGGLVRCFPRARVAAGMRRYERWLNSVRSHEEIVRDLFVESPLAHPGVMMRSQAVAQAGGYRAVGWPEDYDLWFRLHQAGARFEKVPTWCSGGANARRGRAGDRRSTLRASSGAARCTTSSSFISTRAPLWRCGGRGKRGARWANT